MIIDTILSGNFLYTLTAGIASGLIAHFKGDDRLRWFLAGFAGWLAPIISILFAGKGQYGKKNDKR